MLYGHHDFPSFSDKIEWWQETNKLCAIHDDCVAKDDGSLERVKAREIAYDKWLSKMFEPFKLLAVIQPPENMMLRLVPLTDEFFQQESDKSL